jgi:hypothetical protein
MPGNYKVFRATVKEMFFGEEFIAAQNNALGDFGVSIKAEDAQIKYDPKSNGGKGRASPTFLTKHFVALERIEAGDFVVFDEINGGIRRANAATDYPDPR